MCTKWAAPTGDERDEDILWALKAVKAETGEKYDMQQGTRTFVCYKSLVTCSFLTFSQLKNQYSCVRQDSHNYAKALVPGVYDLNCLSSDEIVEHIKLLIEDDNFVYHEVDGDLRDAAGKVCAGQLMAPSIIN